MKNEAHRIITIKIADHEKEMGVTISGLRTEFEITKDLSTTANRATIKIYNLSEETRNRIGKSDSYIEVRSGVNDEEILFIGNIRSVASTTNQKALKPAFQGKRGLNMVTTIEALDGLQSIRDTQISLSHGAGTAWSQVLEDVTKKLNLSFHIDPKNINFTDHTLKNGEAFIGKAVTLLDKASEILGLSWSVQDNKILFIVKGSAFKNIPPIISAENGMVGSPEKQTAKDNSQNSAGWNITTTLMPNIMTGSKVAITSEDIPSGSEFKVMDICHIGDTHGDSWTTKMEVIAL